MTASLRNFLTCTVFRSALKHPQFQDILQEATGWDLVIASPFLNEAGVMLANHFKSPMILYLPANAGSFLSLSLGHPDRSSIFSSSIFFKYSSLKDLWFYVL